MIRFLLDTEGVGFGELKDYTSENNLNSCDKQTTYNLYNSYLFKKKMKEDEVKDSEMDIAEKIEEDLNLIELIEDIKKFGHMYLKLEEIEILNDNNR